MQCDEVVAYRFEGRGALDELFDCRGGQERLAAALEVVQPDLVQDGGDELGGWAAEVAILAALDEVAEVGIVVGDAACTWGASLEDVVEEEVH